MAARSPKITSVGWVLLPAFALTLPVSILGLISMFVPYVPSRETSTFCHYVITPVYFVWLFGAALFGILRARRNPQDGVEVHQDGWLLKLVLGAALFAFGMGWFAAIIPAIPAKFFARTRVNIPVTVDRLDGFQGTYDYWTWIYFKHDGHVNRFMWTRSDALMQSLKHGDCIELHGRQWPLGLYVDSISRLSACYSTSQNRGQVGLLNRGQVGLF